MICLEICSGAGGQSLGLERAGFVHAGLVEIDPHCCTTLRANRPDWPVFGGGTLGDVMQFDGIPFRGKIDLLAGGIPCPPFSVAGKKLGELDERNLFPHLFRLVEEVRPRAVMIENVPGLLSTQFAEYRERIKNFFRKFKYEPFWEKFNACEFGVPQFRPRAILVAVERASANNFSWPCPRLVPAKTVGQVLADLMASRGWKGVDEWTRRANKIAPTIVGGSKKHGGPDLGPTRAKRAWAELGVNGCLIGDDAPEEGFVGAPKLTIRMVARLQGFPDDWEITGKKTNAYRQIGNAFPPPVAQAVGEQILNCLSVEDSRSWSKAAS
ncbi:MAG TPA: DNA cytosine methyltransferase [Pyrinomonadaceae bacterium]|nr:DNA cytosine methyltransferase [Pyrinomonadaceae bacterium]